MDTRTVDEVVKALRSAVRALRAAEKALLQAPSGTATPALPSEPPCSEPASAPAEQALDAFLLAAAESARTFEEQDPQSFRVRFDPLKEDLFQALLKGDMYQSSSKGAGMVSLDNTAGTEFYEQCLKGMRVTELEASDILLPHLESADLKTWGDVDPETDLVFMRYETTGDVEANLDPDELQALMEEARKVPGAIDRIRSSLADKGIRWEMSNARTGDLATSLFVSDVEGKWVASFNATALLNDIVGRLAVVEVDNDAVQEGWWDAARSDRDIPRQIVPIVRSKEPSIICHQSDIENIEDWAAGLPGWYDGTDDSPTPLVMRNAVSNDILS